jgi:hypothetical protein
LYPVQTPSFRSQLKDSEKSALHVQAAAKTGERFAFQTFSWLGLVKNCLHQPPNTLTAFEPDTLQKPIVLQPLDCTVSVQQPEKAVSEDNRTLLEELRISLADILFFFIYCLYPFNPDNGVKPHVDERLISINIFR